METRESAFGPSHHAYAGESYLAALHIWLSDYPSSAAKSSGGEKRPERNQEGDLPGKSAGAIPPAPHCSSLIIVTGATLFVPRYAINVGASTLRCPVLPAGNVLGF